jgi:hypothetical protein
VTASEKLTLTAITTPALYEPFAVDDVTEVTVGAANARTGKENIARINVESDLKRCAGVLVQKRMRFSRAIPLCVFFLCIPR